MPSASGLPSRSSASPRRALIAAMTAAPRGVAERARGALAPVPSGGPPASGGPASDRRAYASPATRPAKAIPARTPKYDPRAIVSCITRTGAACGPRARKTRREIAECTPKMPPGTEAASCVRSDASAWRSASRVICDARPEGEVAGRASPGGLVLPSLRVKAYVYPQIGLRIAPRLADPAQLHAPQPHRHGRRRLQVAPPDLLLRPVDVDVQLVGAVFAIGDRERALLARAPSRDRHHQQLVGEHPVRGRAQDRLDHVVDGPVVDGELGVSLRHRSIAARC